MQNFCTFAFSDKELIKFVFVGVWVLVVFGGVIFKMMNLSVKDSSPNKNLRNEDMENAKRRLQEMIRERQSQSLNPSFPKVEKPVFYEEQIPVEKTFLETKKLAQKKVEDSSSAYHQNSFDYNAELKAKELSLEKSEIASKNPKTQELKAISSSEIKDANLSDFLHDKELLKKSILISEILDKPLSLR